MAEDKYRKVVIKFANGAVLQTQSCFKDGNEIQVEINYPIDNHRAWNTNIGGKVQKTTSKAFSTGLSITDTVSAEASTKIVKAPSADKKKKGKK